MTAKNMIEYSVSVPADRSASIRVNHAPGGSCGSVEIDDVRCDWSSRSYEINDDDE
ncbi:hypothetical protein P8A21_13895 [Streptomyces poriferorum]|uniref:hypothetical protein n=1 Tax=Streptomyces TaxID=1883 RepID=UPI002740000E|nr:hypothetical protein [Streptomyces sp. Alt1]WLQ48520.1 hypothetical protein P8A21_13895 [Streptomyces sp. Alt1]